MNAVLESPPRSSLPARPFDLGDEASYRAWRAHKLATQLHDADALIVDVADPRCLSAAERLALLQVCARVNMALYRSPHREADPELPRRLGQQLGLQRLDANWLAEEDGISRIEVEPAGAQAAGVRDRGAFIPYTDRAIQWHTDGYYHPASRRIRGMILHCVRSAARGGQTALIDPELAYIALRDASPRWVRALMAPDAMTIPAREDADGAARPAQSGPVFSVDPTDGTLHMRYTARTRSIQWKDDAQTAKAVAWLAHWLADGPALRLTLGPGMGLVSNNVLHERSAFVDDPGAPRLLYRARYLDRVTALAPWPSG
jgi:alpha-ketoglutarate-dependent taurine dioxygenase